MFELNELSYTVQELSKRVDETKALMIGMAAVIAHLPGADAVTESQAKQTASEIIGYGSDVTAPAGKMITLICQLAKNSPSQSAQQSK
jgi:hypothetical protein